MSRPFPKLGEAKRIRCKACGWTARIAASEVGTQILYHRDVTCPAKIAPAERPKAHRIGRASGLAQRIKRPTRPRCPTCRESLALVNGAYACVAGCSNEPTTL